MNLSRWVKLKADDVAYDRDGSEMFRIVAGKDIGIIHHVDDKGIYVCFPRAHRLYQLSQLQPAGRVYDVETALKTIREYEGHHCRSSGEFQFNIKCHAYKFPDKIERYSAMSATAENQVWEEQGELLSHELRCFVGDDCDEGIIQVIEWVDKSWHQAGRSGGWLVLKHTEKLDADSLEDDYVNLVDCEVDDADQESVKQEIKELEEKIISLAISLDYIQEAADHVKESVPKWIATEEAWESFMDAFEVEEALQEDAVQDEESVDGEDGNDDTIGESYGSQGEESRIPVLA